MRTDLSPALRLAVHLSLAGLLSSAAPACDDTPAPPVDRVFATVSGADEIAVIDAETSEVIDRVPVGQGPAIILRTPDAQKLYTANWADDTVSAVDTRTLEVTNIELPGRPYVIATPPAGDFIYVGVNPSGIAVIDTETDSVIRTFPTSELAASLIVSPDGKTLYVATLGGLVPGTLRAVSTQDGSEVHPPIEVGYAAAWITIHPDGSEVYTLNFLSDDISVVDTKSWTVKTSIDTGAGSQAIIANVTPDGKTLFVTNHGTAELMAIETATHTIRGTAPIEGRPVGVQFSPDGKTVYTTDFGPESLDQGADLEYLTTGNLTTAGDGYVRAFDVETLEPVGEPVLAGPGATSLVTQSAEEAASLL